MKVKQNHGFTLVEMAIVLVIIGIILAGVMKGRDIVRGAQVKQFSQQFAQKWGTICQTYYDKTGRQLNDGLINGGDAASADGYMDASAASRAETAAAGGVALIEALNGVGIEPCTMIKSKLIAATATGVTGYAAEAGCPEGAINVMQTTVDGEYAGSTVVTVDLVGRGYILDGGAAATNTYNRNSVVLYQVPVDVARGLDTAIDGKEDGQSGSCINMGLVNDGDAGYAVGDAANLFAGLPGAAGSCIAKAWPDASDPDLTLTNVAILLDY